ncbi:MAG: DEAD/DEAH box helicase [Cyclobacteriaceae bacterium]
MSTFEDLKLSTPLRNAIEDLGFTQPTPIQEEAYPVILSGKDVLGIAQTGTGKTLAYMLPILKDLKFSTQINPRALILVPTRELVLQVVEQIGDYAKYMNVRVTGVYGGTNINTQKIKVLEGADIIVATPGRLYDLVLSRALALKDVKKLVIDEVDVMLDLGFRFQLTNIMELLPERRQNIMFSATMTDDVELLINDFFVAPKKISIAVSGTPLENIEQLAYPVKNFYTKANLLVDLLRDRETFQKVLVFVSNKKGADRLFEEVGLYYESESCIIHSNKSQNYRIRSIKQFEEGSNRILIATDVMARGLDLDKITHVINFDTPGFPENYMHRIGRTGRAEEQGHTILFYTEKEEPAKLAIEELMKMKIEELPFPDHVEVSTELTPEERPKKKEINTGHKISDDGPGAAFHEKKLKNTKFNQGGSYKRKAKKHKNPITRGDKAQGGNKRKRRG